jgi:hypothetical protein
MMLAPAVILSLTLATFYASVFHAVAGRKLWQWPLFWGSALAGFMGGFVAGVVWDLEWLRVGDVPLLSATVGAAAVLALAWFFSAPAARRRQRLIFDVQQ